MARAFDVYRVVIIKARSLFLLINELISFRQVYLKASLHLKRIVAISKRP